MTLVVPCTKGGVPHLTADLVAQVLSLAEERCISVCVFDAAEYAAVFPNGRLERATDAASSASGAKKGSRHVKAQKAANPSLTVFAPEAPRPEAPNADTPRQDFTHYAGLTGGFQVILTVRSPRTGTHATAPSTNASLAGQGDTGRVLVGPAQWASAVAAVKPRYAVPIHDSPDAPCSVENTSGTATNSSTGNNDAGASEETAESGDAAASLSLQSYLQPPSKRRRTAATERSARWLLAAVAACPAGTQLLLPASALPRGGIAAAPPAAASLCGGVVVDSINHFESFGARLAALGAASPASLPTTTTEASVILCQAESPQALLLAVLAGATHIEAYFPFLLAERGIAMSLERPAEPLDTAAGNSNSSSSSGVASPAVLPPMQELRDPAFRVDPRPLSRHCRCYCCQRHSRAYIHHLLTVQEMNATILLSLHNLTQVVDALRVCRQPGGHDYAMELLRVLL